MRKLLLLLITSLAFMQDYSLEFDGVNDYINCGSSLFDISDTFTYELYVKPDKEIDIPAVLHQGDYNYSGGNQNYIIFPELAYNGTGLSIGNNGLHVFEHGGGYLYPVLTYEFEELIDKSVSLKLIAFVPVSVPIVLAVIPVRLDPSPTNAVAVTVPVLGL